MLMKKIKKLYKEVSEESKTALKDIKSKYNSKIQKNITNTVENRIKL